MYKILLYNILILSYAFTQTSEQVIIDIGSQGERFKAKCLIEIKNHTYQYTSYDMYLCKKGKRKFYLREFKEFGEWSAIELTDNKAEEVHLNEVLNSEETLYKSIVESVTLNKKKNSTLNDRFNEVSNLRNNYGELLFLKSSLLTKNLSKIIPGIRDNIDSKKSELLDKYSNRKLVIAQTADGKKIKCTRGANKSTSMACKLYVCEPIEIEGEKYEVSLRGTELGASVNSPYLILSGKKSLGPDLKLKKIILDGEDLYSSDYFPEYNKDPKMPKKFKHSESTINKLTNPMDKYSRKYDLEGCEDKKIDELEKNITNNLSAIKKELQSIKLVELIEEVDGILQKKKILESDISSSMCRMGGDVYFYDKKNFDSDALKEFQGFNSSSEVVDKNRLDELFNFAKDQKDIPYAYYQDGCYARAHILSKRIEDQLGIDTEKIWATGPLSPPNDKSVRWSYHVAPKINVIDEDGSISSYVIDPSVSDRALLEDEWIELISINKRISKMRNSWPPVRSSGAIKNIQVSYTSNETYGFNQKTEVASKEQIEKNYQDALKDISMYRSYLNEN